MKILLMGPQGSGKGTVGAKLSKELDYPMISVGQVLRDLTEDHPEYKRINEHLDAGELAPQDIVAGLLKARVGKPDCDKGVILDGWFRCMKDIEYFDYDPDAVFVIQIGRDESIKRITGRRICTSNGKTFNVYTLPKEELEECDGELIQRDDDTEEAVNRRLDIYEEDTLPVIAYLKERGTNVYEIDGEQTPDQVFESVMKVLKPII